MSGSTGEVNDAKRSIRRMLGEQPRPTQRAIATATGLSQGYVAKINRCSFSGMSDGIRRVVEYSRKGAEERAKAATDATSASERISDAIRLLAARDPELGALLVDLVEGLAARTP